MIAVKGCEDLLAAVAAVFHFLQRDDVCPDLAQHGDHAARVVAAYARGGSCRLSAT